MSDGSKTETGGALQSVSFLKMLTKLRCIMAKIVTYMEYWMMIITKLGLNMLPCVAVVLVYKPSGRVSICSDNSYTCLCAGTL